MPADAGALRRRPDPLVLLGIAGFAVYVLTGCFNVGIFAHDDYVWVMKMVLPAQSKSVGFVVQNADIRNPLPMLVHLALVKAASGLGLEHPLAQMRFDQAVLGGTSFLLLLWAGVTSLAPYPEPDRARHRRAYAALLGFHFAAAFILTRPMFESLTAPVLALGTAFACRYHASGRRLHLALAVAWLSAAVVLRPQAAVTLLALPLVIGRRRQWRDLGVLAAVGIACFLAAGFIDQALRGGFHESFRRYLEYNFAHAKDWGVDPWYRFILLLVGLSIPPVFLTRYRGLAWRARYEPLVPALLVFGLFVAAHSVVPHKEERFMIPILPTFFLLLTPLAIWLIDHGARWRIAVFALVDGGLLALAVANRPQRTGMELAAYLDRNPSLDTVVIGSDDILFPGAFVAHPVTIRPAGDTRRLGCGTLIAVLSLTADGARAAADAGLTRVAQFQPGPLERMAILVNPRRNTRRGPIDAYVSSACRPDQTVPTGPVGPTTKTAETEGSL